MSTENTNVEKEATPQGGAETATQTGGAEATTPKYDPKELAEWYATPEGEKAINQIASKFGDRRATQATKTAEERMKATYEGYIPPEKLEEVKNSLLAENNKIKIDNAIDLMAMNYKHPELIKKEFNRENIKVTENGVLGVAEEDARIRSVFGDLLKTSETPAPTVTASNKTKITQHTNKQQPVDPVDAFLRSKGMIK